MPHPGPRAAADNCPAPHVVVRALRDASGLTQQGWAAKLGYSVATVRRWETGTATPTTEAEEALISHCQHVGLFRTFDLEPLRGFTLTAEVLRDLLAEARLRTSRSQAAGPGVPPEPSDALELPGALGPEGERTPTRAALPTGTLTFVLTDVEGSTSAWLRNRRAMSAALARHDAVIEETVAEHGGQVVRPRGEGDSRFAVFARPSDAVAAACVIQIGLAEEQWQLTEPLHVRMAVHTGEADLREGDYYGPAVNRCARLRGIAQGGQVLVSAVTAELVRESLSAEVSLLDLGVHQLKDLEQPERVWQLVHPKLRAEFPPLTTRSRQKHNLPNQLTTFVGREHELAEVRRFLGSSRLVTLTGTGGVGKTRLALEVAAELVPVYPDGVWLVELAPLGDPALVPQSVAAALGIPEQPGQSLVATLVDAVNARQVLLVLDNCEHLVEACAHLAEALLTACPELRILVTSREPLRAAGETTWRVPSLSLPEPLIGQSVDETARSEAELLFLERASAVRPEFGLNERTARAVADLCRRLDGIPLALELAAGRVGVLDVEQIATRLDDRFRLLVSGRRTAPPRHQTLRATVEWSYELLGEQERQLFDRLAVFTGGWTLEAAEAVCTGERIDHGDVLDLLAQLVDKSLVVAVTTADGPVRYRMLESLRWYAQERLAISETVDGTARRHANYYLALAESAERELTGGDQGMWLEQLEQEHDNLRAALHWALSGDEVEVGLRLGAAMWRFWAVHAHVTEGRQWLMRILGLVEPRAPLLEASHAAVLNGAANLASFQGDHAIARSLHAESLALSRELADPVGIATSLMNLGIEASIEGDYFAAQTLHEESLAIWREQDNHWGIANSLNDLGTLARTQGNCDLARSLYEQSLAIRQTLGDHRGIAMSLGNLADVAGMEGDYALARSLHAESVAIKRDLKDRRGLVASLEGLAKLASTQGQAVRAVRLAGAAARLRASIGVTHPKAYEAQFRRLMESSWNALDSQAAAAVLAEGEAMSLEQALEYALEPEHGPSDGDGGLAGH